MRHVDGPPARRGRLGTRGFSPGVRGLGFRRLGVGGCVGGRRCFRSLVAGRLGLRRLGPGGLGPGFRSGLSLPVARGIFFARLLQRDLLLDGLLLAPRFLIRPFLTGRLALGGPRRGGPVQPCLSRRDASGRFTPPGGFTPPGRYTPPGRWLVWLRLLVSISPPRLHVLRRGAGG